MSDRNRRLLLAERPSGNIEEKTVRLEEADVPEPGPGEVVLAVEAAGLCHSDLSVIDGTIPYPTPVVLGHEGAGVVDAVGPGVQSVKEGDAVVLSTLAHCGRCAACEVGRPTECRNAPNPKDTQPFVTIRARGAPILATFQEMPALLPQRFQFRHFNPLTGQFVGKRHLAVLPGHPFDRGLRRPLDQRPGQRAGPARGGDRPRGGEAAVRGSQHDR